LAIENYSLGYEAGKPGLFLPLIKLRITHDHRQFAPDSESRHNPLHALSMAIGPYSPQHMLDDQGIRKQLALGFTPPAIGIMPNETSTIESRTLETVCVPVVDGNKYQWRFVSKLSNRGKQKKDLTRRLKSAFPSNALPESQIMDGGGMHGQSFVSREYAVANAAVGMRAARCPHVFL
jgi:hypothetical protein